MTAEVVFDPLDEVTAEEVAALVAALEMAGAEPTPNTEKTQGFAGTISLVLSVKLAILTAGAVAMLVAYMYAKFQRGVLIDLSQDPTVIKKNPDLPRGTVLIIDKAGKSTLHTNLSSGELNDLIGKLFPGAPKAKA